MAETRNQVPEGAVLAHTMWGEPKSDTALASAVGRIGDQIAPAPPGGVPYVDPRRKKCKANHDSCEGWRKPGYLYCPGHLRQMADGNFRPGDDG